MLWAIPGGIVAFLGVLFAAGTTVERSRGVRFRAGWTTGVVGLRGGGKSLFVARLIATRLKAGVPVVANFSVPGCERMTSWEDCIAAPPGTMVVLDEAHQWARASAGKSPDPMADWYVSHSRKLGHEVWWIAQHESQIAGFVKNQTNEMVECEQWLGSRHRAKSFAPHAFRKKDSKPLWVWWYSPRGAATRVYDTYELVEPVINDRDPSHVVEQKLRLRNLIAEINRKRASANGVADPGTIEEPPTPDLVSEVDGSLNDDAHVT